ncbi:MAG: primosomal protein N' [Vibrio sp.]
MRPPIARVALPVPLDKCFDYKIPAHLEPVIGGRVLVPFGRNKLIGIVTSLEHSSDFDFDKLKPLQACLDQAPIWPQKLYALLQWCSQYYQYPLGETLSNALPGALRKAKSAQLEPVTQWQITALGIEQLSQGLGRAHQQKKILEILNQAPCSHSALLKQDISSTTLKALEEKRWVSKHEVAIKAKPWPNQVQADVETPQLNQDQAIAVATINQGHGFHAYLLDGVTGSGKTEVYLNVLEPVLQQGKQALILVPEIGLTPQTINRFKKRFNVEVDVIHSGLNETERMNAWIKAKEKHIGILIGTRSALFTPFADLGIIIVDEEHDASYKQQDSLRYHARDVAVMRAHRENIPIVLGSATPSIETIENANQGKYQYLNLSQRAGVAKPATHQILDVKGLYLEAGLSAPLIAQMRQHLNAGNQVLLFLNRRGFSPALMCHECGWIAECTRCDAYYTYHQGSRSIRCHHCGSEKPVLHQCHGCGSTQLISVGVGTEQLEQKLNELFAEFKTIRIDRDSTRRKGSFDTALSAIRRGEYQILIGTQMLAKGHHFPDVTLVGLLDIDGSLYSSDFRAAERLAQLFIQVAGRAGRASKPGHVVLQTHHPEHTLLQSLTQFNYQHFAKQLLAERKLASLPPFCYLALFKASANESPLVEEFLRQVKLTLESNPHFNQDCYVLGPIASPIAKRAGMYRWQLLFQSSNRLQLQKLIASAKPVIQTLPTSKKVRWHIDIEPQDLS